MEGYVNGSQLAKMKKSIPYMLRHKISRVEAVGLKKSSHTFKITIFMSMWNLGQFR